MSNRWRVLRGLLGLAVGVASFAANGAARGEKPAPSKSQPIILTREAPNAGNGDVARARARKGDCAGALDAFDSAIRANVDPVLRRDRGLCHEKLAHPWPAIDDYRAYLKERPDAPDAEQIRERLARLEEQVGVGGGSARPPNDESGAPGGGSTSGSLSLNGSLNGEGASVRASASSRGEAKPRSESELEADEKLAAAASGSPLRESSGWIIGPYFGVRATSDVTAKVDVVMPNGTTQTRESKMSLGVNEVVGAAIRYSLGKTSTLISEIGYVSFNDSQGGNHVSGAQFLLGYEARIPFTRYTSDAIVLGAGVGYERYHAGTVGTSLNVVLARGRVGYRHVFGSSVGLEVTGDGGVGQYWSADLPGGTSLVPAPVFGGYVALVVGF